MRDRLYFRTTVERKKEILEALKNEQKMLKNKKIVICNKLGEEVAKIAKFDTYYESIDFWLDDYISETATEFPGKIQNISTYNYTNNKGQTFLRIKEITA